MFIGNRSICISSNTEPFLNRFLNLHGGQFLSILFNRFSNIYETTYPNDKGYASVLILKPPPRGGEKLATPDRRRTLFI
jgi:hypothetical protein